MTHTLELDVLREAIDLLPEAVAIFDPEDRFMCWNRRYAEFYAGSSHLLVRGRSFEDFLRDVIKLGTTPAAAGREEAWLAERMARHRLPASTYDHEIADGRWVRVEERRLANGGSIGLRIDITALKRRERELDHLAHHDHLTGLPNRAALHRRLEAETVGGVAAVLLIDLDGFKDVNDSWGHKAGDAVLRQAAERIARALDRDGFVARMGGDEFCAVLPGCADPLAVSRLATLIIERMTEPFGFEGREMRISASIGAVLCPNHATDPETLLHYADLALYKAKDDGRRCMRVFTPVLQSANAARLRFNQQFHRALAEGEFVLHYQPQIRLEDGALLGAEALIRWQHPELGLLQPGAFLPALLASRQAEAVGAWVVATACRQAATWRARHPGFRIAVNAGPRCVTSGAVVEQVGAALAAARLDAGGLEIEITEGTVLTANEAALEALRRLRQRGVSLALDDYGTGYASLSVLKDLPLRRLKIDRSFVGAMDRPGDRAVVRAILHMAEAFGLGVVAEGIETAAQAEALRRLGCQEGQGYWIAKPLPAAGFEARFIAADGTGRLFG